jgi:hypothetical protein
MTSQYDTTASLTGFFLATEDDSLEWLFPLGDINDTSYPALIKAVAGADVRFVQGPGDSAGRLGHPGPWQAAAAAAPGSP